MGYLKNGSGYGKGKAGYGKAGSSHMKARDKHRPANEGFGSNARPDPGHDNIPGYDEVLNGRVVNAESLQIDATLNEISKELRPGETLILDIGSNFFEQTDEIYDTRVLRGYDVRKTFRNGRNQIIVSRREPDGNRRH